MLKYNRHMKQKKVVVKIKYYEKKTRKTKKIRHVLPVRKRPTYSVKRCASSCIRSSALEGSVKVFTGFKVFARYE